VNARQPNGVYLRADTRANYGNVVRVLAVIQAAGIDNAGLILEEERVSR